MNGNSSKMQRGGAAKTDGKLNGKRAGFATDTGISGHRAGGERELQRWVPDASVELDGSLEKTSNKREPVWDQFQANEAKFGLKSDYHENIYTTAIDVNHPKHRERVAAAERKAREIERSNPTTAHVAEERKMDFVGGDDDGDEEEKYSGVRRNDFPALPTHDSNKYTPPARRAPTGSATVKGAPVDPAIISSQLKPSATAASKLATTAPSTATKATTAAHVVTPKSSTQLDAKKPEALKPSPSETTKDSSAPESKASEKPAPKLKPAATPNRNVSPSAAEAAGAPSATSTVERDLLKSFKNFAVQERTAVDKAQRVKAKADKQDRLSELKKFAQEFKLTTPVPDDLIGIIAKDPSKQKEIQARAKQNASGVVKKEPSPKDKSSALGETPSNQSSSVITTSRTGMVAPSTPADTRGASRAGSQVSHVGMNASGPPRHPGSRTSYATPPFAYRNDRPAPQTTPRHNQQTGHLAQRLRNVEQKGLPQSIGMHDPRGPPTGPSLPADPAFSRRPSGLQNPHLAPRLNPHSHEFRPSVHAPAFNPVGMSTASSPHSAVNTVDFTPVAAPALAPLVRRKTKAVAPNKCSILGHIQAIQQSHSNAAWAANGGLRPAFDTAPTWKQPQDDEKPDSMMQLKYKDYFERQPFAGATPTTANPAHALPLMAHQHQLPFHLQNGGPRPVAHGPPASGHGQPNGQMSHGPYANGDEHRMIHSSSSQSYASPRPSQLQMTFNPSAVQSPGHMPYNQPMMQPYMGAANAPHMGTFRGFPQGAHFVPQQPGQPMMIPSYVQAPGHMMPAGPGMQIHPSNFHQFMPGGHAPQQMTGPNGFPSPGRHTATMMVPQGSQQGNQVPGYGMSPGAPYQQPMYAGQHHPGHNMQGRSFSGQGPFPQMGTSPGASNGNFGLQQHRNASNQYNGKAHNQQGPRNGPNASNGTPQRPAETATEPK